MSATLPAGDTLQGWVTDDVGGSFVSALPAGETLSIVSADTSDFTVSVDNPMVAPPAGTTAVASFTVTAPANPSQPNVPVDITISVSGSSPGVGAAAPLVDTITVSLEETQVLGDLFGTPVAPVAPSAAAEVKK